MTEPQKIEQGAITDVAAHSKKKRQKANTAYQNARRHVRMLVVDASKGKSTTISPEDYGRLGIDQRYQRPPIWSWIATIREAATRGSLPKPIDLVRRLYAEDGVISKKLWVVDGQQRMWALVDLNLPIQAVIHEVESYDEEVSLFLTLNARRNVSANRQVTIHPGPTHDVLREANCDPNSGLYNRILLADYVGSHERVNPMSVVTAIQIAFGIGIQQSALENIAAVDYHLKTSGRDKVNEFIDCLGLSFTGKPRFDEMRAFARAYRKLGRPLTQKECNGVRRLRLSHVTASTSTERVLLMARRIMKSLNISED